MDRVARRRAKVSQCRKTERGDPLRFFNIHSVAKHEKIEGNKNFHFREKISQCRDRQCLQLETAKALKKLKN